MKVLKLLNCFCFLLFVQFNASAQLLLKKPAPEPGIQKELSEVIKDYQYQFSNITGDIINENPQSIEYASTIQLPGADGCYITKYSSGKNDVYSWRGIMLITEDFEEASKKFRSLYKQLNNLQVRFGNYKSYRFNAPFEEPAEEKDFLIINFTNDAKEARKLKLELSMRYEFPEWKVSIQVFEKEREDHEMGNQVDTDDYIEY